MSNFGLSRLTNSRDPLAETAFRKDRYRKRVRVGIRAKPHEPTCALAKSAYKHVDRHGAVQ